MSSEATSSVEGEQRFVSLEEKLAYLEKLTGELNDVVISQAESIDQLQKQVKLLAKQAAESGEGREFPHEAPPHY